MGPNRLLTPHGKSLMRRPARPRRLWSFERLERRILLSQVQNPVGINPFSSVSGDFNRDGALDVVTANEGSNDVSILLGNGDGTFQAPMTFAAGASPIAVTADDFNGDGRLDLAVADQGDPKTGQGRGVSILLGNGDGTFQAPVLYDAGISPTSIVAGYFEGEDRPLDLAVAGTDSNGVSYVSILQGDGYGGFHLSHTFALGDAVALPKSITAGYFEGEDRPLDLAVANYGSNNVSILLGNGQGGFQIQSPISLGVSSLNPISIVAGEFGNGPLDLAVANYGSNNVSILLGNGQGGFQVRPPIQLGEGTKPTSLTAVNFEADGTLDDLAIADAGTNQVSLLKGNGDGTFQPEPLIELGDGGAPSTILAGDFNRDGIPDLAISRQGPNENDVVVELNLGGYQFADPGTIDLAAQNTPIVADFTGDGIPDVAIVDAAGDILFRQGRADRPGSFDPPIIINPGAPSRAIASVRTSQGVLLASVDLGNNPGGPSPGTISLFAYRNGQFTLVGPPGDPPAPLTTGPWPAQLVSADLSGDGWDDLIVRNSGDGTLTLYRSDGHGWFQPGIDIPVGLSASDFTVSDIAQDGLPDLVVTNHVSGEVEVLPNQGGGKFGPPLQYPAGSGLSSQEETAGVVAGAFTQGGPPDLVTINPGSNTFAVLAGLGGGALANPMPFPTTTPATVVRTGDFTGDGIPDLAVLGADGVSVYLGNGHGGFGKPTTYYTGPDPTGLTVADVTGDGIPDLLVGNQFGDVLVLRGNGDGTFQPYRNTDQQITLAVADLRGNGQQDVIYADQTLDQVTVQYGAKGTPSVIGDRSQGLLAPGAVTVADLNGDGIPDLIVANSGSNNVLIYPGLGNGQFGPAQAFPVGTNPVGITVANLNGRPDLVVADEGSNDIAILLNVPIPGGGFTFTNGPRLQLKTPTKQGIGPVATTVLNPPGGGPADLLVSNSGSNDVWLLPGVGGGFFNDQNPTIFPVGSNPGPLFVGNFDGKPDLVTVNAGSNDLTFISDFMGSSPVTSTISSGGIDPVAALMFPSGNGFDNLIVGNNGDGRLALFLGGLDGLNLAESMVDPEVAHPTALALDVLTGNLLQFYAGTEGVEAATLLAFNLGGVVAPVTPPVQQVAQLQPLSESSLALIATLLSVTTETTPGESEATNGEVAVPTSALPNQSAAPVTVGGGTGNDANTGDQEEGVAAPVVPATAVLTPLARFVSGLDEAFEKVRLDARRGKTAPGQRAAIAAQAILALDAALERWSPVITTLGGPAPALVGGLGRIVGAATRAVDAALHALSEEGVRTPPPIAAACADPVPATPPARDTTPTLTAVASLGLMALARALVDNRHHLDTSTNDCQEKVMTFAPHSRRCADRLRRGGLRGVRAGSAAHNAVGLAGESPVVGIDCLPT